MVIGAPACLALLGVYGELLLVEGVASVLSVQGLEGSGSVALLLLLAEESSLCWWLAEFFGEGEDLFDIVDLIVARFQLLLSAAWHPQHLVLIHIVQVETASVILHRGVRRRKNEILPTHIDLISRYGRLRANP